MPDILQLLNQIVWGAPALILILGVGLWLSMRTNFVQIRLFPRALRSFFAQLRPGKTSDGTVPPFRALCTALAATVGTGNIAGVAGAISIGGPGAIFWMWLCALLGMGIKFAEATLAVRYRVRNQAGEYVGGPMYMIQQGLGSRWTWLGGLYSFFGVVAAFGVGNATQINAVLSAGHEAMSALHIPVWKGMDLVFSACLAVLIAILLLGGAARIGKAAELLVPFASLGYVLLGAVVLVLCRERLPWAFRAIIQGAFTPQAITGGVIGSAFQTLRIGVSRGVFTHEAGMGTASIAHAASDVSHPVQQGMMGIVEVFLDTIVICTMTALVILCSGVAVPYGATAGAELTTTAFASVLGNWVPIFLALALCCFALATVLGWGLYGVRCAEYLFGIKAKGFFVALQAAVVVLAAVLETKTVWILADTVNGLMLIPNLIALAALSPELVALTRSYDKKKGKRSRV